MLIGCRNTEGQGTRRGAGLRPWGRTRGLVAVRLSRRAERIAASPLQEERRADDGWGTIQHLPARRGSL